MSATDTADMAPSQNPDPREWHDEPWCRFPIQRVTRDLCNRLRVQRQEVIDVLQAETRDMPPLSGAARIFLIHLKGHLDQEIAMIEQMLWSEEPDEPIHPTTPATPATPQDPRSA